MAGGRPTEASHFEAVVTQTPRLLATADGESVGCSPSGTKRGQAPGCNGMDSRLRAALTADGVTPISLAT
ncbi:MAG: hypothetical protein JWM59_2441 [Verrucomicrobiales bacterium]|nr:hypothetical protein [Verrucomicrobiales bacterium]